MDGRTPSSGRHTSRFASVGVVRRICSTSCREEIGQDPRCASEFRMRGSHTLFVRLLSGVSLTSSNTSPSSRPASNAGLCGKTFLTRTRHLRASRCWSTPPMTLKPKPVSERATDTECVFSARRTSRNLNSSLVHDNTCTCTCAIFLSCQFENMKIQLHDMINCGCYLRQRNRDLNCESRKSELAF